MIERKIIRAAEVLEMIGLSRTTLWRLVKAGKFPAPLKLSVRARGWRLSDVEAWLDSRERFGAGWLTDRERAVG